MTENERWCSVIETAQYLGIKQDTLYKWIHRKDIPANKVGRLWKFKLTEVDAWIKSSSRSNNKSLKKEG